MSAGCVASSVDRCGLDEITEVVPDHGVDADVFASEIIRLQMNGDQSPGNAKDIAWHQGLLDEKNEAIAKLEKFYVDVTKHWSNMKLQCNIGHVEYTPAIKRIYKRRHTHTDEEYDTSCEKQHTR